MQKKLWLNALSLFLISIVLLSRSWVVLAGEDTHADRSIPHSQTSIYPLGSPLTSAEPTSASDVPSSRAITPGSDLDFAAGEMNLARDVTLGQPGFSLRYLTDFGVRGEAFFEDTNHFVYPFGVGSDGSSVWVADTSANRALKFAADGTYLDQIGIAGDHLGAEGTTLEVVGDVAVDSVGNIWVADMAAHHVDKFDSSGNYIETLGEIWAPGSDNSHFEQPRSIAFDSNGFLYVSDTRNQRIQVFNSSLNYVTTLGETGVTGSDNTHFYNPNKISIDASDYLYVGDATNDRVQIFDVSSTPTIIYVTTLGESGVAGTDNSHFDGAMAAVSDASQIYVADFYNNRIQIFNKSTYGYVATIGSGAAGSANNEFNWPSDVALDSSGNLYVADQLNFRVQQFDNTLTYARTYGTTGVPYLTDQQHYFRPSGVAVASGGAVYISEEWGQRLVKVNSGGVPLWSVGEAGVEGEDNQHFTSPMDVDLDSSGQAYVADAGNHRIQIFSSGGAYVDTFGSGYGQGNDQFNYPSGVGIGPSDTVYVCDQNNHRIQVFNSSGSYIDTIGQTGVEGSDNGHFSYPRDVHVNSSGYVYVADNGNHRVQVFDPTRTYLFTIGVTGISGWDFEHLDSPTAVTVDSSGRIYVADQWGGRIQVFTGSGAYLTTIPYLEQAEGLAIDDSGDIYAAIYRDHVIEKYTPGVPDWGQININGFGMPYNDLIFPLLSSTIRYLWGHIITPPVPNSGKWNRDYGQPSMRVDSEMWIIRELMACSASMENSMRVHGMKSMGARFGAPIREVHGPGWFRRALGTLQIVKYFPSKLLVIYFTPVPGVPWQPRVLRSGAAVRATVANGRKSRRMVSVMPVTLGLLH